MSLSRSLILLFVVCTALCLVFAAPQQPDEQLDQQLNSAFIDTAKQPAKRSKSSASHRGNVKATAVPTLVSKSPAERLSPAFNDEKFKLFLEKHPQLAAIPVKHNLKKKFSENREFIVSQNTHFGAHLFHSGGPFTVLTHEDFKLNRLNTVTPARALANVKENPNAKDPPLSFELNVPKPSSPAASSAGTKRGSSRSSNVLQPRFLKLEVPTKTGRNKKATARTGAGQTAASAGGAGAIAGAKGGNAGGSGAIAGSKGGDAGGIGAIAGSKGGNASGVATIAGSKGGAGNGVGADGLQALPTINPTSRLWALNLTNVRTGWSSFICQRTITTYHRFFEQLKFQRVPSLLTPFNGSRTLQWKDWSPEFFAKRLTVPYQHMFDYIEDLVGYCGSKSPKTNTDPCKGKPLPTVEEMLKPLAQYYGGDNDMKTGAANAFTALVNNCKQGYLAEGSKLAVDDGGLVTIPRLKEFWRQIGVPQKSIQSLFEIQGAHAASAFSFNNHVSQVNDICGSCWAHTTIGVLQGFRKLLNPFVPWGNVIYNDRNRSDWEVNPHFSPQQILNCVHTKVSQGCSGGSPMNALEYLQTHPIALLDEQPLTDVPGPCVAPKSTKPPSNLIFSWGWKLAAPKCVAHSCPKQGAVEWMLLNNILGQEILSGKSYKPGNGFGTIIAYVDATSWQHYRSGLFPLSMCSNDPKDGNHVVTIGGFAINTLTGMPEWIIQNSWGEDWGDRGRITLPFGVNACGLANFAFQAKPPPQLPGLLAEREKQISQQIRQMDAANSK